MTLYLDLETRSSVNLSKEGVKRYVTSPDFSIILIAWAYKDSPVRCCTPTTMPLLLKKALKRNCKVVIHNSVFDVTALKYAGLANIKHTRLVDTMIQAYAHALPPSLDALSRLYQLGDKGKLRGGTLLINFFCKPTKAGVFRDPNEHSEKWQEFINYAKNDVEAMRQLYKMLPNDNYPNGTELKNYYENLRINCSGLPLDMELIKGAVELYDAELKRLNEEFKKLTGFNISQNKVLLHYLNQHGVKVKNVQASTIEELLAEDTCGDHLREVLKLKQLSAQVTPKKYITLQKHQHKGKIYHTLQFMGASRTGRDAGRVFQPQNLKRPTLFLHCKTEEEEDKQIEDAILSVTRQKLSQNVIPVLGDLIRNVIKPQRKDFKIVVSDLSNIEGRTLTYLAEEEWKLQFFRDFDARLIKYDNYVMAYSKAMDTPPNAVTKEQRAIGKVMELAMGYGGGVGSFLAFSKVYGLDMKALYVNVFKTLKTRADKDLFFGCDRGFDSIFGITLKEYMTCQYLKKKWRFAHPNIVSFWNGLEKAFRSAVELPNTKVNVGKLVFIYEDDFLKIILPSGRKLMYYKAKPDMSFITPTQTAQRFERETTYGGRLSENVASGVARDVLYNCLISVREAGFKILSLVHDEIITECPNKSCYSPELLSSLLSTQPTWALDLPLSATGFSANRYKGK